MSSEEQPSHMLPQDLMVVDSSDQILSIENLVEESYLSEDDAFTIALSLPSTQDQYPSASGSQLEGQDLSELIGSSVYEGTQDFDENLQSGSEDDDIEPGDIPVCYENALILNENYKLRLTSIIEQVELALHRNRSLQSSIDDEIRQLQNTGRGSDGTLPALVSKTSVFTFPYFKDINGYGPPPNDDTKMKRHNQEIDGYLTNPRPWSEQEKKKFLTAIREEAVEKRMKKVVREQTQLLTSLRRLNPADDKDERQAKEERLRELKNVEDAIRSQSDEELFDNRSEEFDWMKLSAQCFDTHISPESCKLMWQNLLHPSINRSKWSRQENESLMALVQFEDYRDWDAIAEELGTGRTPFQCFHRYVNHHKKHIYSSAWSVKEDRRLVELVEKCRINNYIPWTKVAYYMHNRTKEQCYQRWTLSAKNGIRRGKFNDIEDFAIIVGAKILNRNWARISEFIPHREPPQLYSRHLGFINADFSQWTKEEDHRLLELVREYGVSDWTKIAKLMPSRKNRSQCRRRFHFIYKMYSQKGGEGFGLAQIKYTKAAGKQQKRQLKLFDKFLIRARKYFGLEEDVNPNIEIMSLHSIYEFFDEKGISTEELRLFFEDLCREIPVNESFWYDFSQRPNLSNRTLGIIPKPKLKQVILDEQGKSLREFRYFPGRPTKGTEKNLHRRQDSRSLLSLKTSRVEKALTMFFRPSYVWTLRRSKVLFENSEAENLGSIMACYANMFSIKQEFIRVATEDDKKDYRFAIFKAFEEKLKNFSTSRVKFNPAPIQKPVVRTYSRKKTEPSSRPVGDRSSHLPEEFLKLVPPNKSTLVGLRGLLLCLNRLKRENGVCGVHINPKDIMMFGVRTTAITDLNLTSVLPDRDEEQNAPSTSKSASAPCPRLTPAQADRLLRERFLSLFFWPGHLSLHNPGNDTAFLEDQTLAAEEPFDTSDVISEAQSLAGSIKRMVVKRPEDVAPPSSHVASSTETTQIRETAPPPHKKRILASTST